MIPRRFAGGVLGTALVLSGCGGQGGNGNPVLVVGAVLPLSGREAAAGAELMSGMELFAAGSGGRIRIEAYDGGGEPSMAARRFTELAQNEDVSVVVGGWGAATARPLAALAYQRMCPFVALSPLARTSAMPDAPTLVFRSAESLAIAAAAWARDARETAVAGVFRDPVSEVSRRLADAFQVEFKARGGQVAWTSGPDATGRPVRPAGPEVDVDVVFVAGPLAVATAVASFGPRTRRADFLLVEGWGHEEVPEGGPPLFRVGRFSPDEDRPAAREFRRACERAGLEPTSIRAQGWDAILALAVVADEVGTRRAALGRGLLAGDPIEGATGRLALRGAVETPALFALEAGGERLLGRVEARTAVRAP